MRAFICNYIYMYTYIVFYNVRLVDLLPPTTRARVYNLYRLARIIVVTAINSLTPNIEMARRK